MDFYDGASALLNHLTLAPTVRILFSFTVLAILLPAMLSLWHDYLAFLSLGPGGTPSTFSGFLRIKFLGCFALPNPYEPAPCPRRFVDVPGYLRPLPKRPPPRPCTRGIAPHRQITQKATRADFARLSAGLEALAAGSGSAWKVGTSCFEKHGTGLFSTAPDPWRRRCGGEICHVHPSDGSMHMTLHPADARAVLEAGWGERHPISRGGWFERFVPGGFVMVYAPRNEDEVETALEIVRAAAWFVGGGGEGLAVQSGRVAEGGGVGSKGG